MANPAKSCADTVAATAWWRTGIIYQIYPRSFQDSNGDGVGDLPGIITRLDYLAALGIDAIWLSPVYPSPMADFGYDISDHTDVHPLFGTLADLDRLIACAHGRGLKVILDFVPNHTSHEHPWFLNARSARTSARRDWYIWRDPAPGGGPPNNWLSEFGGSAWTFDAATGQCYHHAFLKEQPDLNWRNPEVVAAMHAIMEFWFRRGVDGLRVDAVFHVMKDADFRDNPVNPAFHEGMDPYHRLLPVHSADTAEVQIVVAGLRQVAKRFGDRLLIGEAYLPFDRLAAYFGRAGDGVQLPFNFALIGAPWRAEAIAGLITAYEASLPKGAWPNWVLSNHDRPRIAGRVGPDQARVAAMLLLTLRGTPTLYYGDELGMAQVTVPRDRIHDPYEKNVPGLGLGRDGARTPMQWDGSRFAGFSTVEPWLPLADDATEVNVKAEKGEASSMLTLTRRLIDLRRRHGALNAGDYGPILAEGNLLLFVREGPGETLLVALNFGDEPLSAALPGASGRGEILLSTCCDREGEAVHGLLPLRPNEGVVVAAGT